MNYLDENILYDINICLDVLIENFSEPDNSKKEINKSILSEIKRIIVDCRITSMRNYKYYYNDFMYKINILEDAYEEQEE